MTPEATTPRLRQDAPRRDANSGQHGHSGQPWQSWNSAQYGHSGRGGHGWRAALALGAFGVAAAAVYGIFSSGFGRPPRAAALSPAPAASRPAPPPR
ncbi:hypothetical protein MTP10_00005, partial [Nonomuraea sp. 3-1Str]|nr:hypothetical protein [Nonomuraea sp. 3-1Str]